ncbi:single-stranded DNA exonuclease [Thermotoga sp. RQ7]|uniref:single-stranded-DNA-specific exonuclease RecJ n=1 Tax=Thermotoga sp. RQ7 TaxID=126738 RepID=UPI0005A34C49|nr:single-stranded-DNA-specific exonuclease RecJ [Thermotoga sp. RQ7]AJG41220.1 single-stranded DNA exonuclease [Thermotoga sp. RQ7]MDK2785815.1 single-stranded-DNA-specific exonuclease [Thermotoga sp.]MDK2950226.1 single-stranded-DNA-specific exonuclease [Thermotoga sp.]
MKKWELSHPDEHAVKRISQRFDLSEIAARVLVNRGIDTEEAARSFLFTDETCQHDPFLFKDMEKAVETLLQVRSEGQLVLIHGDYDVDGITSAVVLKEFLEENGWKVDVYIPHRIEEGYGVQKENVLSFKEMGVSCLVTVDCGITAVESIDLAKRLGMRVIVTDHHEVNGDIPPADAVVNPKVPGEDYPFRDLAGVGVTYKLVQALAQVLKYPDVEKYLELVALGTVADMVSLLDENRYFVKKGIELLMKTERLGLKKLLEKLGLKKLTSHDISYKIAPRLNAAGRMGSATDAFVLLTMKDPARTEGVVERLMELNNERRRIERQIYKEAVEKIEANDLWKDPIIVVAGENWHVGVIGIVAAKLANRYEKPVAVVSLSDEYAKGSIRSYNGYDIMNAFSGDVLEIFDEIGGHSSAAGFSLRKEHLESFKEYMKNVALEMKDEKVLVDAEVSLNDVDERFIEDIQLLMPFGQGNPEPVLLFSDLLIEKIHFFGEDNSNVFLHLKDGERKLEVIGYNFKSLSNSFSALPVAPTRGSVVVNLRPMGDGLSYYLVSLDVKPIFRVKSKEVSSLLKKAKEKKLLVRIPYPSRTKFLLSVKEETGGRLGIISLTNASAQNVSGCLARYSSSNASGYVNSVFTRGLENDIVVFTLVGFLKHLPLNDFDMFIVNEFQDFVSYSHNSQVQEFLNLLEKYPGKFLFVSSMKNPALEDFLRNSEYEVVDLKTNELEEFLFSDQRGRFDLETLAGSSGFSIVVSEKRLIPNIYKKLGKKAVVYYAGMDLEKKLKVVGLIESGSARKAILTSNTDGLPTHIRGDIIFYDFPFSIYEIVDLLRRRAVINLCYSSQDMKRRRAELERLFPSPDKLEEIACATEKTKDRTELEKILESDYGIKGNVLKDLYMDLIEELRSGKTPWRVLEGDLEKRVFEDTVSVLTEDLKDLYSFFRDRVIR